MAADELAKFAGVTLSVDTVSAFTTKVEVARITQIQVSDTFNVQSVDDFDAAAGAIIDQLLGGRQVTVTFGTNYVPSDAGFQKVHTQKKTAGYSYLELLAVDTKGTVTTRKLQLGGYFSEVSEAFQKPAGTTSITFVASEVLSDDIA